MKNQVCLLTSNATYLVDLQKQPLSLHCLRYLKNLFNFSINFLHLLSYFCRQILCMLHSVDSLPLSWVILMSNSGCLYRPTSSYCVVYPTLLSYISQIPVYQLLCSTMLMLNIYGYARQCA